MSGVGLQKKMQKYMPHDAEMIKLKEKQDRKRWEIGKVNQLHFVPLEIK